MNTDILLPQSYTWLVTGGAGFIGSHLVKTLLQHGQRVRVLDNFSSGFAANLAPFQDHIDLFTADIRNAESVRQALEGVDYVLHHAALVSVAESVEKPLQTLDINVQGTANVLQAAREAGVKRVVFASSSAVYGNGKDMPYTENSPVDCQSPYALSKQTGAELCQLYTRLYGLETVSLRYFNVFGPGQNPHAAYAAVIAKFMQFARLGQPLHIDGNGRQSRDFVYIDDIVQANLLAARKAQPGEIYNVASGKTYSLLQLADLIEKVSGRPLPRVFGPRRAGDVDLSAADISKFCAQGYRPGVSLEEGLRRLWTQTEAQ